MEGRRPEWQVGTHQSPPSAHKALSSQCYRDLALVSRDGMNLVLNKINQVLMEKYLKLQDTCRTQVRPEQRESSSEAWQRVEPLLGTGWKDRG